jgi:hypothetical protein
MMKVYGTIKGFNIDHCAHKHKLDHHYLYNIWKLQGFSCFACKKEAKIIEKHQNGPKVVLICKSCVLQFRLQLKKAREERPDALRREIEEEFEQPNVWAETVEKYRNH